MRTGTRGRSTEMVKGHNLQVGDIVRNKYVPALIGEVTVVRPDGVIMVKVEGKPAVNDVGACWERVKPMAGVGACWERIKPMAGEKED